MSDGLCDFCDAAANRCPATPVLHQVGAVLMPSNPRNKRSLVRRNSSDRQRPSPTSPWSRPVRHGRDRFAKARTRSDAGKTTIAASKRCGDGTPRCDLRVAHGGHPTLASGPERAPDRQRNGPVAADGAALHPAAGLQPGRPEPSEVVGVADISLSGLGRSCSPRTEQQNDQPRSRRQRDPSVSPAIRQGSGATRI